MSEIASIQQGHELPQTLVDCVRAHAATQPDRRVCTYLESGEREAGVRTFADLDRRATDIASWLLAHGLGGKTALLLIGDALTFVDSLIGCFYAGVIAVPVAIPRAKGRDTLIGIARDARVSAIVTTANEPPLVKEALATSLPQVRWLDVAESSSGVPTVDARGLRASDIALLQYTSGSTGSPKGVMVSHGNIMANQRTIQIGMELHRESVFVGWLPLYHDMGLIGNLFQTLFVGGRCVLMPPAAFIQTPVRWLRAITQYRGTLGGAPNFAFDMCVDRIPDAQRIGLDLSSWEVAYSGSERIRAETVRRFVQAFRPYGLKPEAFYPCYGMAESTLMISGHRRGDPLSVLELDANLLGHGATVQPPSAGGDVPPISTSVVTCGRPINAVVRIVDKETGQPLSDGTVGEIWVHGDSVTQGYFDKPDATEEIFRARCAGDDRPYLRTGDLGFLRDGQLYITGRVKDLIIVRGRNLYPQDLEAVASVADDLVAKGQAAAVGFEGASGEALAIIAEVTREGWRAANLDGPRSKIREALVAAYGVAPERIVFIRPGSLPRTTSGKVRRLACRAMMLDNSLDVAPEREWTAEAVT